ncbi:MAG TPA: hypothetical protein VMT92_01775 [Steroidobacteraceae bacterium]|nr:hypothetical protein [Steroidobacteraceae bacterium]
MRAPRRVRLDFVAPVHEARGQGIALCVLGVATALAVGVAFEMKFSERNELDATLSAISMSARPQGPAALRSAEDASAIERELSIPWSQLLAELEAASHDSASTIALLQVEPDPTKRIVKITAEARTLPAALEYLQRLQKSPLLRYPMLESHERKKDDPEHPVRVKLAAEWR